MSTPVTSCLVVKAVTEGGKYKEAFLRGMKENLDGGSFSVIPCECSPPCGDGVTEEQLLALHLELEEYMKKHEDQKDS